MALTSQDLKAHLWNCAEILRGSAVDRADWKAYILPLQFFKRISDVWDEERADAARLFGDADPVDFPEVHRFIVPAGCHWRDVRETPANVGAALSHAMREIERANLDTLYRVFGAADWGNREMLTDEILKDLMEGLSEVSLGNKAVGSNVLGDAYEYLIGTCCWTARATAYAAIGSSIAMALYVCSTCGGRTPCGRQGSRSS